MRIYFASPGADLSDAELSAASLDGELVRLGLGWVPAGAVETPALRAASLAPVLGDALAAVGPTAAWIHGALATEPQPVHAQRAEPTGGRRVSTRTLHVRDVVLPAEDQERLGGVRVSTAARTLVDLVADAISPDARGPAHGEAIRRLRADPAVRDAAVELARGRPRLAHRADILAELELELERDENVRTT